MYINWYMGRTPRKYVITPGMHIPARPSSAPASFQATSRRSTETKLSEHKLPRRTKKHIAPLPTPETLSEALEDSKLEPLATHKVIAPPQEVAEPVPAAVLPEPEPDLDTQLEVTVHQQIDDAPIEHTTEAVTAPEVKAEPIVASDKPLTDYQPATHAPFNPPSHSEVHPTPEYYEADTHTAPSDGSHTLLPGAPFGPHGDAPLLLEAHNLDSHRKARLRLPKAAMAVIAIALIGGAGTLAFAQLQPETAGLSNAIVGQVTGFTPYYLGKSFKTDFVMVKDSAAYKSDTLTFTLSRPDGKQVTITEVKTPDNYDIDSLEANEIFNTTYGRAFVVDKGNRTTGALFTNDKTWILANAASHITVDEMHNLIANFGPIKQQ